MPRCPDCNLFVGVELADPEMSLDVSDGEVTGEVRLVLCCAECGTELSETSADVQMEFEHPENEKHSVGIHEENAEPQDYYEGKGRGARHFYAAEVSVALECSCGWKAGVTVTVSEQASFFESMV